MQVDKWGLKNAYFCYIVNVWVIIDPHWNLESRIEGCFHIVVLVIIDPHWNLELCQSRDTGPCRPGNNRSTLEFRGCKRKILWSSLCVIIDPHWNLEETDALFFSRVAQVIIDPHWNLEIGHNLFVTASISVIIDPHWNLETLLPISYQDIRISNNRSTLEFRDV